MFTSQIQALLMSLHGKKMRTAVMTLEDPALTCHSSFGQVQSTVPASDW